MERHRDQKRAIKELTRLLLAQRNANELEELLEDLLTPSEKSQLLERWDIVRQLLEGKTQRAVKDNLGVSISKVSRGSQAIQYGKGAFSRSFQRLTKNK